MTDEALHEEAELCRQRALSYVGQPEAPFLLRVARELDRLAMDRKPSAPRPK